MIEIIYNDEEQEEKRSEPYFHLPKNIRQIGEIDKGKKIYIEDYAVTYIEQFSSANMTVPCVAVLLGKVNWLEGVQYIFISGVLPVDDMDISNDRIVFTDRIWTGIYENVKKFFSNQEIVGWFLCVPGYPVEITEGIFKAHVNHFGGNDKVFMMRETIEKDEAFFLFENGRLSRQPGYYIYYEKNESMQEFMISQNEGRSVDEKEELSDEAIQSFRRILQERKEENQPKKMMAFMYAASTFLVITVLVIGITMINSHDKMKSMEETLVSISRSVGSEDLNNAKPAQSINVENVDGNISKETEEDTDTEATEENQAQQTENVQDEAPVQELDDQGEGDRLEEDEPERQDVEVMAQFPQEYTIAKGDTLAAICKKFYGTASRVADVCEENNIDNIDKIYPGQKIVLPE